MAPGAGQAIRHPGSAQCMHWSLRISQWSPFAVSCSPNRIRFQKLAVIAGIVWYVPLCTVGSGGRSFHSWHATSHALQPMHVDVSMSFVTIGCTWTPEAGADVAEMRMMSRVAILLSVVHASRFSLLGRS